MQAISLTPEMQESDVISERGGDILHRHLGKAVQQEAFSNHETICTRKDGSVCQSDVPGTC